MMAMSERKPSVPYSFELSEEIVRRFAGGEALTSICSGDDMPDKSAIYLWTVSHPDFADRLSRAREARADVFADDVVHVSDTEPDPARARVRADARKWAAGVLNPRRYGNKLDVNVTERVSVGRALQEARARLSRPVRDHIIEHATQATEEQEEDDDASTDCQSDDGSIFD